MNWTISGSKSALNLDYLEPLRQSIIEPLVANGSAGVPATIERLRHYSLRREDIDTINELTLWKNQKDPMSAVESKVKAALTRAYNKESFALPYSLETTAKGKKSKTGTEVDELDGGPDGEEGSTAVEDDQSDDDIESSAMIKKKKVVKKGQPKGDKEVKSKKEPKSKAKTTKKEQIETKESVKEEKKTPKKAKEVPQEEKKSRTAETKTENEVKKKKKKRIVIESDSEEEEIVVPKKKEIKDKDVNTKPLMNGKKNRDPEEEVTSSVRRSPRKAAKEPEACITIDSGDESDQPKTKKKNEVKQTKPKDSTPKEKTPKTKEKTSQTKDKTPKAKEEGKPSKVTNKAIPTSKSPQGSLLGWLKKSA